MKKKTHRDPQWIMVQRALHSKVFSSHVIKIIKFFIFCDCYNKDIKYTFRIKHFYFCFVWLQKSQPQINTIYLVVDNIYTHTKCIWEKNALQRHNSASFHVNHSNIILRELLFIPIYKRSLWILNQNHEMNSCVYQYNGQQKKIHRYAIMLHPNDVSIYIYKEFYTKRCVFF